MKKMNKHSGRTRRCRGRVEIARMVGDSGQRRHRGWKRKHYDGDVVLASLVGHALMSGTAHQLANQDELRMRQAPTGHSFP